VKLFDAWPERYEEWFRTPMGRLVKKYEKDLILDLLDPNRGERVLDAGCGTGIFTSDILASGARVVGLDISMPMLHLAGKKGEGYPLHLIAGDMTQLPLADGVFDKTVSVTAIEFIEDAKAAFQELSRVTKRGGVIVVATLNNLSPWADRRKARAREERGSIFRQAVFRSPDQIKALMPGPGVIRTAIHFLKGDDPRIAEEVETRGRLEGWDTGAFVAAMWKNP
jgi:ubiquinone/menaquinone biosynthesis C-methylase UbiE